MCCLSRKNDPITNAPEAYDQDYRTKTSEKDEEIEDKMLDVKAADDDEASDDDEVVEEEGSEEEDATS